MSWLLDFILERVFHPLMKGKPNMRETPMPELDREELLACVKCDDWHPHLVRRWQPTGDETAECSECGLETPW